MFAKHFGAGTTSLDCFPYYFLAASLFERACDGFFFDGARHSQNPVHVSKNQVSGFDVYSPNFDRASVGHDLRTDACVLRIAATAEYRPVLLQYAHGVAMVSIDDCADSATNARR